MLSITIAKLNEYRSFRGDDDGIALMIPIDKRATRPEEWYLIRSLIQDIKLVRKGLASAEYAERVTNELIKYCDGEGAIEEIRRLAEVL